MNLLVQQFLLTNSLDQLEIAHGVFASLSKSGRKMSLNYGQREAKSSDPLACQCRGLILAREDGAPIAKDKPVGETKVVARPFDRFFNMGDGAAAQIDFNHQDLRYFEKQDGTLCIVHYDYDASEWHVATRSVPEADVKIDGFGEHTFRTLFEKSLQTHGLDFGLFSNGLARSFTYMFELTTPMNRVLVKHDEFRLHHLGTRETRTGKEFCPTDMYTSNVDACQSHTMGSVAELLDYVASKDPTKHEGIVVRGHRLPDGSFARIKVKNPAYMAAARIKDSTANSPRALLEVILLGKDEDVFPLLSEHLVQNGLKYKAQLAATIVLYDARYAEFMATIAPDEPNPRKSMALQVQAAKLAIGPFMSRFSGQCDSFRGYLDKMKKDGTWNDSFLDSLMAMMADEELRK